MAQLVDHGNGRLSLSGRLTSATVAELALQGHALLTKKHSDYEVDLAEVSFGSSAGVALMLAWLRAARAVGVELTFANLPSGMRGLLRVSKLEDIIPLRG